MIPCAVWYISAITIAKYMDKMGQLEQKEQAYWEQRKSRRISTCRRQHASIAAGCIYELEKAMKANMQGNRYEKKKWKRGIIRIEGDSRCKKYRPVWI